MKTTATMRYRVYGTKIASWNSFTDDFSSEDDVRIIHYACHDETGTDEYVDMTITRNTFKECENEFNGQYSDGTFENERCFRFIEI